MSRRLRGRWAVRLPTWLGDTVMAVPTIRALATAADELLLWGPEHHGSLLQSVGVRARLLSYRRRRGPLALLDVQRGIDRLAAARVSGAVLLPNAFEPALIARMAGVRRRVGYASEFRGRLLTDPLTPPDVLEPQHESRRFARLLSVLKVTPPRPEDGLLAPPPDTATRVAALLGDARPLFGIVPGCANGPAKRWPSQAFAQVACHAARRWSAVPVLLGGPQDREIAREVAAAGPPTTIDLTGRTDAIDLAAVLSRCGAVVSNDTGAAHLAAALSTPTLVLFGPTDPRRTRPLGPHVRVASVAAFCQPCLSPVCALDHRCMTALTPDVVRAPLDALWRSGRTHLAS